MPRPKSKKAIAAGLMRLYQNLFEHFGHRNWWPAPTPFEVCVGAILTQNTAWTNVERAIANLKTADALSLEGILALELADLAELIRPSGYFNQKAKRLADFCRFIRDEFGGSIEKLFEVETGRLREMLLAQKGIGPETADSMMCYGGNKSVFVVDAYTIRAIVRIGYLPEGVDYATTQKLFVDHLPRDVALYNDFHAQFVALGANICKKTNPLCKSCPVRECDFGRSNR